MLDGKPRCQYTLVFLHRPLHDRSVAETAQSNGLLFLFHGCYYGRTLGAGDSGRSKGASGRIMRLHPRNGGALNTSTSQLRQEQPQPARSTQVTALVTRQTTGADRQAQTGHAPQCLLMEDVTAVITKRPLHSSWHGSAQTLPQIYFSFCTNVKLKVVPYVTMCPCEWIVAKFVIQPFRNALRSGNLRGT